MKQFLSNKSFQGVSIKGKINLLQNHWLKSFKAPIPYAEIAPHLVLTQYRDQEIICRSNDKISTYYFLIDGTVNAYETKQELSGGEYFCQIREPQSIGQNIYSFNTHRSCTWRAVGTVKCCKINAELLINLTTETVAEYNNILFRLSEILNVDSSYLSRYQLYKKMVYREFIKNNRITENNQRSGHKSLFMILEGECKFCIKSQYLKQYKPNQPLLAYQQHILNLCENEIIGIEPLLQVEYKYDYIVSTAKCSLIELNIKDMRDNYFQFPPELYQRINQIYSQHKVIVEKALSKINDGENEMMMVEETGKGKGGRKNKSEVFTSTKMKKFLQDACMYVPVVNKTVEKREKRFQPTSAFIPLKKRQESTFVEMKRKDWRSYIKLPIIQNKIIHEMR